MKVSSLLLRDDHSSIIGTVTEMVETFVALRGNPRPESNGGYFTMMSVKTGLILLIVPIGEMPPEKAQKYFELSQEKARRLLATIKSDDCVSSWQTRKPDEDMYGGAIKISVKWGEEGDEEEFILSFSGLPEVGDEAVVLCTAIQRFDFDVLAATQIVEVSENPFFLPLLAEVHG